MAITDLSGSGKRSSHGKVSEKSVNFDLDNAWQPCVNKLVCIEIIVYIAKSCYKLILRQAHRWGHI